MALDWETRSADAGRYRHWLERLYGFHAAWEPAVAAALADPAFVEPRRKLSLIAADLAALGVPAGALDALPRPAGIAYASPVEALGSMYVLEGSTLGGQLIARRVAATLDHQPHYHGGYGAATGAMWRAFRQRLDAVPDGETDAAIAAAAATFVRLRVWLTAG